MSQDEMSSNKISSNKWIGILLSLLLGLIVGIFFHYLLYRITLPAEPFIYVKF